MAKGSWKLLGPDGAYTSETPGLLGGNSREKIYGRLDCPAALKALPRGIYQKYRVFFADEATAIATGYRPCGTCLRKEYARYKAAQAS